VTLGPVRLTVTTLWSMLIAVIALAGVAYFLLRTRAGRATRAVSDNPALSAASGISVNRTIRLVWVIGAGLAALGGVLVGLYFGAKNSPTTIGRMRDQSMVCLRYPTRVARPRMPCGRTSRTRMRITSADA